MKCATCYADNPVWQTVCSACGAPAHPLHLCPAGRLLAPGASRCDDCPARWPEVTKFSGHALLRGVVWVENGSMLGEAGIRELPYLELRDRELPYALAVQEPGQALVLDGDPAESSLKVLIRPEGSGFCVKPMDGSLACTGLQYSPLSPAGRVVVAGTTLRFVFFEIPDWVESR